MTRNTTIDNDLEHPEFCLPRPGETERRYETYHQPRYAGDGITPTSYARVHRCMECGSRSVDGRQVPE